MNASYPWIVPFEFSRFYHYFVYLRVLRALTPILEWSKLLVDLTIIFERNSQIATLRETDVSATSTFAIYDTLVKQLPISNNGPIGKRYIAL